MRFEFVTSPPRTVGELARVLGIELEDGTRGLGALHVGGLSATYRFDIHHERPVMTAKELKRRELLRYAVRFPSGRATCEQALMRAHGPAQEVAGRRRFGSWFVSGDADPFTLEWHAETPDWAKPPADAHGRIHAMEELARKLHDATTYLEVEAALAAIPDGLGVSVDGRGLTLDPPMPAADLARALGCGDAVGRTVDVHMASWRLATLAGGGINPMRVGPWEIDVTIDRATGARPEGVGFGASAVAHLAPADAAHRLWVP